MGSISHLIERYIYKMGGQDLAGLIAILGIVAFIVYLIYEKRRPNKPPP
jgi:hypothetical protein